MYDQTSLIQLVTNVVSASALLRQLNVDPEGPERFLLPFADDLARYFEMSVPQTFDRLGVMTRGRDEAFSERLGVWLGGVAGPAAARTFAASAGRVGHDHTYVKAVFAADKAPMPTYYFRRRFEGPEVMEVLAAEGASEAARELVRGVADDLGKRTAAFIGRRLSDRGPDRLKVYLTQHLPDGADAVAARLLAAARRIGLRADHERALRATVRGLEEAGGATLFVSVELAPDVLPELKLYFEKIAAPAVLAICRALKVLTDFEEVEGLPTRLGTLHGMFGAERMDYFGLRLGTPTPQVAFYYYRQAGDG